MPSQRYAIDGAIHVKSVEENEQEGEVPSLTSQNKQGELMPMLDSTMYNKVCRVDWTLLLILNTNTNRVVSYAL